MVLTNEDKNRIINNRKPIIEIDGKRYFSKIGMFQMDGVPLVVEKLADLVGIKSAHIERFLIDGAAYYLSEDLNNSDETRFESAMYSIRFAQTLNEMCDALQDHYPKQTVFLIDKVIKIYMFDTLIMNSDRNYSNWGFLYSGDAVKAVCDRFGLFAQRIKIYKDDKCLKEIKPGTGEIKAFRDL